MVEKSPAVGTVYCDPAATFVQQRMVGTTQQHEIRQRGFAIVGPVLNVMAVDVAAVGVSRATAGAVA